jgi:hypothetical protein
MIAAVIQELLLILQMATVIRIKLQATVVQQVKHLLIVKHPDF